MSDTTANSLQSHPMNGGDGAYSYTRNSSLQRQASSVAKTTIDEAIAEKLDLQNFSRTLRIADLGCSVGPNTFIAMQNVIEAVKLKYHSQGIASQMLEFQVFFNDHSSNDFNTLFTSIPLSTQFFVAGVPGSFHGRLFPKASLHIVYSSYALQWLSKVPRELLDKTSPAWNKGRVFYSGAADKVAAAYATQYSRDMADFLDARAEELVVGGVIVLIIPASPEGIPHSRPHLGGMFEFLGSCLMDMVKEGLISEALVDSFNLPIYAPCPEELTGIVERNGCFSIERMELTFLASRLGEIDGKALGMHLRAGMEGIISKHFGNEIIDQLFDRFVKKTEEFSDLFQLRSREGTQLQVVLKRV